VTGIARTGDTHHEDRRQGSRGEATRIAKRVAPPREDRRHGSRCAATWFMRQGHIDRDARRHGSRCAATRITMHVALDGEVGRRRRADRPSSCRRRFDDCLLGEFMAHSGRNHEGRQVAEQRGGLVFPARDVPSRSGADHDLRSSSTTAGARPAPFRWCWPWAPRSGSWKLVAQSGKRSRRGARRDHPMGRYARTLARSDSKLARSE
jgi:hypothetical protein